MAPYLQNLQSTAVVVRFELRDPASAAVEVAAAGGKPRRFESASPQRLHSVHLTGLDPAATLSYQVRVGSTTSDRGTFTTASADASRPFTFILYGDSRTGSAEHASVVREIEASASDLLVGTGDIVASGKNRDDWLEFFSIEQRLLRDRCLFSVIGNHELVGKGPAARRTWVQYLAPHDDAQGPSYYTFRWGNSRFFMLDGMDAWDGEQARWLRSELARADAEAGLEHRFMVTHHSPFSSGPHGPSVAFVRKGMVDELVRHKVELIMAGHDHLYERGESSGIKYIISGGAGAPLYPIKKLQPGSANALSAYHFVHVLVDGPSVVITVHPLGKEVLERCSYRVGQPWDCSAPPALTSSPAPESSLAPRPTVSEAPREAATDAAVKLQPPPPAPKCTCDMPGLRKPTGENALLLAGLALIGARLVSRRRSRA